MLVFLVTDSDTVHVIRRQIFVSGGTIEGLDIGKGVRNGMLARNPRWVPQGLDAKMLQTPVGEVVNFLRFDSLEFYRQPISFR